MTDHPLDVFLAQYVSEQGDGVDVRLRVYRVLRLPVDWDLEWLYIVLKAVLATTPVSARAFDRAFRSSFGSSSMRPPWVAHLNHERAYHEICVAASAPGGPLSDSLRPPGGWWQRVWRRAANWVLHVLRAR